MITVRSLVRDTRTGLVGRVIDIIPQAEPWRDLVIIRLDKPDPVYGSITSAMEGEVEELGAQAGEGVIP